MSIVNLTRARKAKTRQAAEAKAAENRALHGRGKAAKVAEHQAKQAARKTLDAAKLER